MAYADDMLFSLTNPSIFLPNLLHEFDMGSSQTWRLTSPNPKQWEWGFCNPFSYAFKRVSNRNGQNALKYLGVYIPPNLSQIFDLNFLPFQKSVWDLLKKWHTGLHFWFGRCNILKMSFLPKFLYLLQALPIYVPSTYFNQIRTLFSYLIWAHKRLCLNKRQPSLPKQYGGLAVPDLQYVYTTKRSAWADLSNGTTIRQLN